MKMENINIITIEKNIPIPAVVWSRGNPEKYKFIDTMDCTDSFKVNGNTPDFSPSTIRSYVYGLNSKGTKQFTIRTLEGHSNNPTAIRVWRVK